MWKYLYLDIYMIFFFTCIKLISVIIYEDGRSGTHSGLVQFYSSFGFLGFKMSAPFGL